jgi:hypothetical protein
VKQTQNEKILAHLKKYGSITPLEAMAEFGCMRLASRISDLKRQGYPILAGRGKSKNRNGETVYFAVYRLIPGTIGERPVPIR